MARSGRMHGCTRLVSCRRAARRRREQPSVPARRCPRLAAGRDTRPAPGRRPPRPGTRRHGCPRPRAGRARSSSGTSPFSRVWNSPVMRTLPPVPTYSQVRMIEYEMIWVSIDHTALPPFIWPRQVERDVDQRPRDSEHDRRSKRRHHRHRARQGVAAPPDLLGEAGRMTTSGTIRMAGKRSSNRPAAGAPSDDSDDIDGQEPDGRDQEREVPLRVGWAYGHLAKQPSDRAVALVPRKPGRDEQRREGERKGQQRWLAAPRPTTATVASAANAKVKPTYHAAPMAAFCRGSAMRNSARRRNRGRGHDRPPCDHADPAAAGSVARTPRLHPDLAEFLRSRPSETGPDTPAGSNVAMPASSSVAERIRGRASAAPLPSPSRRSRSNSGSSPSCSITTSVARLGRSVAGDQPRADAGRHGRCDECRGAGDEPVEDDRRAGLGGNEDRADECRDLEPSDGGQRTERVVRARSMQLERLLDHGHLPADRLRHRGRSRGRSRRPEAGP